MSICKQCNAAATVNFAWPTSSAPQSADLCDEHAASWWKQYQHTPSGQCLTITPLPNEAEKT